MTSPAIDLGSGHTMTYCTRYSLEPGERCGIIVYHPIRPDDQVCAWRGECGGWVAFDIPANAADTGHKWQVEQAEPLTLAPSLLCHCGDHGFIQGGRWVPA